MQSDMKDMKKYADIPRVVPAVCLVSVGPFSKSSEWKPVLSSHIAWFS